MQQSKEIRNCKHGCNKKDDPNPHMGHVKNNNDKKEYKI